MNARLKQLAKGVCPDFLFHPALRFRSRLRNRRFVNVPAAGVFADIYHNCSWGGVSVSGMGSDCEQTQSLRCGLPPLLEACSIRGLLDVPCGDFSWMKLVDLGSRSYIGGDIVPELVERNNAQFGSSNRQFRVLDIMKDPLPSADLLLCRDCLIHLSIRDVGLALCNIARAEIPYVLTTNYPFITRNTDIVTGDFRAINLQLPPFSLLKPVTVIPEDLFQEHKDDPNFIRELALWRGSDFARWRA